MKTLFIVSCIFALIVCILGLKEIRRCIKVEKEQRLQLAAFERLSKIIDDIAKNQNHTFTCIQTEQCALIMCNGLPPIEQEKEIKLILGI